MVPLRKKDVMSNNAGRSTGRMKLKLAVAGFGVLALQMVCGQTQPAPHPSQIQATTKSSGAASTVIQLTIPSDIQSSTLSATLNGNSLISGWLQQPRAGHS
jgi:hypothetical protein